MWGPEGTREIASEAIGELVMEGLKGLDDVAYVRFASVYKNFREASDFKALLGTLSDPAALPDGTGSARPAAEDETIGAAGEDPTAKVTPLRPKRQPKSRA